MVDKYNNLKDDKYYITISNDSIALSRSFTENDIRYIINRFDHDHYGNLRYLGIKFQNDSEIIKKILDLIPRSSIRELFIGQNDIIHIQNIENHLLKLIQNPNCKLTKLRGNIKNGHIITDDYKKKLFQNNIFLIDVMGVNNEENKKNTQII
jgi:hypothetical protein